MTTVKRIVYPQDCIESARNIAKNYFVFHRNEVDFLDRGYKAVPNLFKFAFLKEMVDASKAKATAVLEKVNSVLDTYETNDMAGTLETNQGIVDEFESLENFLSVVEEAKRIKPIYEDMLNPTLDSTYTLATLVVFDGEDLYKKGSKVLLNSFTIEKGLISDDGMAYYLPNSTYRQLFTVMSEIGFVYDRENCALADMFSELVIEEVIPSEEELNEINTRHELAEYIRTEDDWGMSDYIRDNQVDMDKLFSDESLVSYCIEMNKPVCFMEALMASKNLIVNPKGNLDPAIQRAIFSVAYRGLEFDRFLGKLVKTMSFNDVTQEIVDEFVKVSFHDLRQEMSLDVFNLYKDKIDEKMLCLALVKNNNVYRMEIPEMKEFIKKAFDKYSVEISETIGIISHLNYYKETMNMVEFLHNTPEVIIGENNILHYLHNLVNEKNAEINGIAPDDDGVDLINGKIMKKSEHLKEAVNEIEAHIKFFEQYVTYVAPTEDSSVVLVA